jgi:glutaredoxin-like protein NrdH
VRVTTVYTKYNCQPCRATKRKLEQLGVIFQEVNVEDDEQALDTIKAMGFLQAPVVVPPHGEPWSGYNPGRLADLAARESTA